MTLKSRLRQLLPHPPGQPVPTSQGTVYKAASGADWYHPVILGPITIGALALQPATLRDAMQIVARLEPDEYTQYLQSYYQTGLEHFGEAWRYADIVTVLLAAARLVHPQNYLEVGVRHGRSVAIVAAACPQVDIVGFDLWVKDYAGMPNPGPDFVRKELNKLGYAGSLGLISGDSYSTLPAYFQIHPDAFFDLATVDGDHSQAGAEKDLRIVLSRLKLGGVAVFDDINHPLLPHLRDVWQRVVVADRRFSTWEFAELGYGVGLAVRRET